jgi:hypothetical protein
MAKLLLRVNGGTREIEVDDPDIPLVYVLRELGLTGTRVGCGLAQCGACTVLVNGRAVRSCSAPASSVAGQEVKTIEGLGSPDRPDPLQAAFIAEQAAQCGYYLTFPEVPAIELELIQRLDQPPLGVGEAASTPVPAALANAVFDATGVRLRTVPFRADRVKAAL